MTGKQIKQLEARLEKAKARVGALTEELEEARQLYAETPKRKLGVRDRVAAVVAEKGDTPAALNQLLSEGYSKASVYCYMSRLRNGKL
nr:MAG TPA: hypothetical protein [Caudoviricetes sp.]